MAQGSFTCISNVVAAHRLLERVSFEQPQHILRCLAGQNQSPRTPRTALWPLIYISIALTDILLLGPRLLQRPFIAFSPTLPLSPCLFLSDGLTQVPDLWSRASLLSAVYFTMACPLSGCSGGVDCLHRALNHCFMWSHSVQKAPRSFAVPLSWSH